MLGRASLGFGVGVGAGSAVFGGWWLATSPSSEGELMARSHMVGVENQAQELRGTKDGDLATWMSRNFFARMEQYKLSKWVAGDGRPKRIILIRHGQTHGYSHTCDCSVAGLPVCALKAESARPLTEEGKLQALQAGVAVRHIIGDQSVTFYSSPYRGCRQTFQFISGSFDNVKSNYFEDPRLRNQDHGQTFNTSHTARTEKFKESFSKVGKFYFRYPEGESGCDVFDRISSFMETLYRRWMLPNRADNYVLITHNAVILVFLMRWFHWPIETYENLEKLKNGQVVVLEKQADGSYDLTTPLKYKGGGPDPSMTRSSFHSLEKPRK